MLQNRHKRDKMERQEFNELLKIAGLTKKVFGEMVGIEYQTINAWGSSGRVIPSWVRPFLECQSKSKAYERVRDEVLSIEGA
jgi:DNA-binding XRE family transcriptional regulator